MAAATNGKVARFSSVTRMDSYSNATAGGPGWPTMRALAAPMSIFYGISVLIGRIAQKRKQAREAAA